MLLVTVELLTYVVNVPCSTLTPPYANQYCIVEKLDLVTGNTAGQNGDTVVVR